ncbi:MAG TPA: hypothetical protein VF164_09870 [Trueperaceae bacterium]
MNAKAGALVRFRRSAWVAGLALVVLLAGCNPFARQVSLAGTWSGTYESSEGDETGVMLLDLQAAGSAVTGTWESSLPGSLSTGTVTGEVGPLIMLELVSSTVANCRFQSLAEQRNELLVGGYMSDCGAVPNGWIELEKR